ncbi:porin family protein [Polaribacter sp. IC073]|uniref:porin family protein n=1 Tax=Polaribacter sp. IC073 TaxID=2508540 RepID=UPI0011BE98A5|nr:porin family protein [Polaribacter sp. IC073]TXD45939.1 PorT family protein [Polaribacter sp. IC073]
MKKVLLAVAIVAAGFTANAQDVKFGAKAGLNFANVYGDDVENNDYRTSLHVGAVAEIEISEKFSLQPELMYSTQGAKTDENNVDLTMKLDYLNVPVMAKYYVAEGFSLEAGPQVGFLLSAKVKAESGGDSGEVDVKDEFETIDFGLNFGAGYKLDSGLNFSARYNLGLSNVAKESDNSIKNGVFQVSVGYFF